MTGDPDREMSRDAHGSDGSDPKGGNGGHAARVYVVGMKKTGGITIPKDLRDSMGLDEKTEFKLTAKGGQLVLEVLTPDEALKLRDELKVKSKAAPRRTSGSRAGSGRRGGARKPSGPEFEAGKYIAYEFPNKDKLLQVLEKSYGYFKEPNPDIEECVRLVEIGIKAYSTGNRIENSRLRYSVVLFICDMIVKFNLPNLIDFATRVVDGMKSRFLYEQALSHLAVTVKNARPERTLEFIGKILENIEKYDESSEMYALVHSLESVVKDFVRAGFSEEFLSPLREFLSRKLESEHMDKDYKLQVVDMLERMHFIEDALRVAQGLLGSTDPEAPGYEEIKEIVKRLEEKPI
ncbi:MAG: AbrB/MazE/SpoVT family DNA-binding domain-containing protein [Promethearchaeota archaeon]